VPLSNVDMPLTFATSTSPYSLTASMPPWSLEGVFVGPQASSCEDANIVVIKASPKASNPTLEVLFSFVSYL
jgi:hypothetical protein